MTLARWRGQLRSVLPNRSWWVTFVLAGALGCTWSLANPLFATSDEAAHVIKAAGVARGQLIGDELTEDQKADLEWGRGGRQGFQPDAYRSVTVPQIYANPNWSCFIFQPDVPAACLDFSGSRDNAPVVTPVPTYPPLYYAIVGLPASLVSAGSRSVYVMRFASALLVGALAATALQCARRRGRLAVAGVAATLTPYVLYLGSSVNPSGFEIASGIALWSSAAVLADDDDRPISTRLIAVVAVSACLLTLSRHLGALWTLVILAFLAAYAGKERIRLIARARAARWGAAAVLLCIALQAAWLMATDALGREKTIYSGDANLGVTLLFRREVGKFHEWYRQMTGMFLGWGETLPPAGTFVIWTMVVGIVLALATLFTERRTVLLIAGLAVASFAIPFVIDFGSAATRGTPLHWQGRHGMAVAVGVPILATWSVAKRRFDAKVHVDRLATALLCGVWLALTLAFWSALRRYTVGHTGGLEFWSNPQWVPPVSALLLAVAFPVLLAALLVYTGRRIRSSDVATAGVMSS